MDQESGLFLYIPKSLYTQTQHMNLYPSQDLELLYGLLLLDTHVTVIMTG